MNSNQNWVLKIDTKVYKELERFPKKDSVRIANTIELLPRNPYFGDTQPIKGEESLWRRRIGAYRIFYDIKTKEKIIEVTWAERKTSKTYRKK